ncbi:carboxypeptidase-like regulatory domain-containing protein [Carboxylicivirga sp. N1Y90]|uniref:TonB-dependent receptor plug domain-containing protein n=1 Tax=Carboxylicivirga fragile TaxID=3417571 RepID=UPI003D330CDC
MKQIKIISLSLIFFISTVNLLSQQIVSGKVVSSDGETLVGVNIAIEGTYVGTITDMDGEFEFETEEVAGKSLVVSYIGFSPLTLNLDDVDSRNIVICLKESMTSLNAVTITAGSFAADDKKRASVLEPLDIYTTAGSLGDINGALKTLPGTQPASDDGRLLVRGGDASETKTFVDGLLAAKPYYSKVPDLPTRGRFSPSLFSGTVFSTGGYSAEYGQALSSVLILESSDVALEAITSVSLMSIGGELSNTWCSNNRSTSLGVSYTNMAPYYSLADNRLDWTKPTEATGINFMHRQKFDNGAMLKVFSTGDYGVSAFNSNIGDEITNIDTEGGNAYVNVNYSVPTGENSFLKTGIATTIDDQRQLAGMHRTSDDELSIEVRATMVNAISDGIELSYGIADAYTNYKQAYQHLGSSQSWNGGVKDHILAGFIEPEIKLSARFAFRPGLRLEYSSALAKMNISPRLSVAYKTGKNSQLSAAYGQYYQNPVNEYLKFTTDFNYEKSTHYIASYQVGSLKKRLLRMEAYYKQYDQLVTYDMGQHTYDLNFNNNGDGYAKGIDIFFRDRETIKRTDYWVSYSYIDTKRQYKDYPQKVSPSFISEHTFSAVAKYFVGAINTQVGATWIMASGRPYHQPDDSEFMNRKAPMYNDLSLNLSYLTHIAGYSTIVHFSMSNVLGRKHLVGYQTIPSGNGQPDTLMPLLPDIKQFMFLGVFISIN